MMDYPRIAARIVLVMSALLVAMGIILIMGGCAAVRVPPIPQSVKVEIEKRHAAEVERDAAIHTSQEAKTAADQSRDEALSLRTLADEKDSEAKRLDAEAKRLRTQEVANRISMASWWLIGAGIIATAVALFMALRFGGRTAWTGVLAGCGSMALGFLGLAVAPWWLPLSWVIGVLVMGGVVGLLIRTLLQHRNAAETMAQEWKVYAGALAPDVRTSLDALSRGEQPAHVRDLITRLLDGAKIKV